MSSRHRKRAARPASKHSRRKTVADPRRGIRALFLTFCCAIIAACAVPVHKGANQEAGDQPAAEQAEPDSGHQLTVTEVTEEPTKPLPPTNPEVLYQVLAGEMALHREEYGLAAEFYERAAALSKDPEIAERATRVALYSGQPHTAREAVAQWLSLMPEDEAARLAAARLYLQDGNADEAIPHLVAIIESTDDPDAAWQSVAQALVSSDLGETAIDVMGRVVEETGSDESAPVIRLQSQLAAQLDDVVYALVLADREVAVEPSADAFAWRGRLNSVAGNTESAMLDLAAAVEMDGDNPDLRIQYAGLLQANDRFDEAQAQLSRLPPDPDLLFTRAVYALGAEREALAEKLYNELAGWQAEDANHQYFLLGQLAELREQGDAARAWYLKVQPGSDYAEARMRLAVLLADEGRVDDALEVLLPLHHTRPQEAIDAYLLEAQILQDAERLPEAFESLNRGLALFPDDVDLLYGRALAAEGLDRIDLAERDLRRILELQPENPTALNALGYTLADRTDRYEEAEELIARALAMRPHEAAIVDSMGWVKFRQGQLEEAESYLRRALELQRDGEIAAHLGEVLWAQGQTQEAREIWLEALDEFPDAEPLLETVKRLDPLLIEQTADQALEVSGDG